MDAAPAEFISPIRVITEDDIDWVMELARARYEQRDYSDEAIRAWIRARLKEPSMHFIRGEHSAGCCHLARRYMEPTRWQAYLTILASIQAPSLSMEPYRIFEALVGWSKQQGATKFWASDITGHDLGSWVRRLGGREAGRTYVIDLDQKGGRYG